MSSVFSKFFKIFLRVGGEPPRASGLARIRKRHFASARLPRSLCSLAMTILYRCTQGFKRLYRYTNAANPTKQLSFRAQA